MQKLEQDYALAFESNPLPMWVIDCETMGFVEVNEASLRQYGYGRDEFLSLTLRDVRPPHAVAPLLERWRHALATSVPGKPYSVGQMEHRRKDGSDLVAEVTVTLIDFRGRKAFLSVQVDVTDRLRAEEQTRKDQERFELVSRAASDTIWDLNLLTGEVWRSGNRGAVFDKEPGEVAPRMEGWSDLIHPEDRDRVVESLHAVVRNGEKVWASEYRLRRGNGTWGSMLDRAFVVYDEAGRAVRMVGSMIDISDRKRIDQELLDQQRRLKAIFDNTQNAIFITNSENRFLEANPAACDLFGYTRQELLSLEIWDLVLEELNSEYRGRVRRLLETGHQELEGQGRRKDGTVVEVEYRSVANIEPGVHLTVMRDVTERKRSDHELLLQKRRLQALFDHVSDGILIFDDQKRFLVVNPAACAMYGYSSKEMLALRTPDLIFEVEHDKYFVRFQRMLSSGKVAGEGQGRRKDGTIVEVEFRSVANIEPGVHFTVVRDITERKRADQELHLQKGRLQALFDQAQDGIVLVDDEGRYIDANPAACEMYGYTRDELRARAIWDLVLPAGTQADRERLRRLRETGHQSGEARRVRRDGTVIELEYRSVSNIEPGVHLTVMRDVTKRNRDEASLRRLSGRLLRLQDEERRRLARELHDSTAQSLAALALELAIVGERGEGLAPRARQALAEAEKIADQVSGELRTLSYLLHPPLLDEMGLSSALNAYVEGFSKRSGVEVELVMPPDIGRLSREDETTLFRIVQECLTNVHRHSMSPTARVRLALEADAIRLEVSDQGRGLAPRGAGDGGERHELGVGIAGMKERVHQLGGDLELDSSADGLTVRAFLPRRQP